MKIQARNLCLIVGSLSIILLIGVAPVIAKEVVIVGEVNEEFQIVADGIIYEIADNEQGNFIRRNLISNKVKVTGTVSHEGDIKIITVTSFEVLAE